MKRLTKRWGEEPYPNLAGKVVCEYKECDSARSCNDCVHGRIAQRLAAIEDILCGSAGDNDPEAEDEYDLDRLAVMCNQRMSMREEVSERFSLTAKIPLDRLREMAEAERDGRCVVLPCKVEDDVYINILGRTLPFTVISISQMASTPTFKAQHGIRLVYIFKADDVGETVFMTREEAEAALAKIAD